MVDQGAACVVHVMCRHCGSEYDQTVGGRGGPHPPYCCGVCGSRDISGRRRYRLIHNSGPADPLGTFWLEQDGVRCGRLDFMGEAAARQIAADLGIGFGAEGGL